jgi:drug/metabolite transporter (DMT)-like permease
VEISRRAVVNFGLLVLVNAMWSTQYVGYKAATDKMGPIALTAWTFLFATLVLLPFVWREKHPPLAADANPVQAPTAVTPGPRSLLSRRNIFGFLMLGVVAVAGSGLLAWGEKLSTASNGSLISLTVPIITALLAALILNERMTLVRWVSLGVALGGVLILSNLDWRHLGLTSSTFLLGNTLILLACTANSLYNVFCKEMLSRFTPLEVLTCTYVLGLILTLPLLIWVEPFSLASVRSYDLRTWVFMLVSSVFSFGLAMLLWAVVLTRIDVSQASVSIYLLPFFGVLLSAITLHERITLTMVVGGLVTLGGTMLMTTLEAPSS